jgi:hypothetical protein
MSATRAMVVAQPGGRLRVEERPVPEPARHEVEFACMPAACVTATRWS